MASLEYFFVIVIVSYYKSFSFKARTWWTSDDHTRLDTYSIKNYYKKASMLSDATVYNFP